MSPTAYAGHASATGGPCPGNREIDGRVRAGAPPVRPLWVRYGRFTTCTPTFGGAMAEDGRGLEIDGVSKRYGEVTALADMTFTVAPGSCSASSAATVPARPPRCGSRWGAGGRRREVRLGGRPVDLEVRRRIGYMPEERGLYPKMKVGAQLAYLAELHGLMRADARAAVARWTERLDIAHRVDDAVESLSLGNQQRVQLAAALVHDPDVLVLDEPFSGLDPVAVDVMSDVLAEKRSEGVPVIFSSHLLDLVERICDRVGIVVAGRMSAVGTVEELRHAGAVQVEVHAPQALPGWVDAVPGARVVQETDGRTLVELGPDGDDQALLAAALRTGPVHSFTRRRPSLTELFREVVSA